MQRRKPFFLATSICLLIGGAPEFAAAQTAPPAPAAPVSPATPASVPAAPADPTATPPTVAVPATAAPVATPSATATATKAPEAIRVLVDNAVEQANKDWSMTYLLGNRGTLPDKRVSVDQKKAKIKDVLKDALDQAKIGYVFDADVPDDTRVSVKLDNVKIGTALDAITDSAGLKWQVNIERVGRVGNALVRIGKSMPEASTSKNWNLSTANPGIKVNRVPNPNTPFNSSTSDLLNYYTFAPRLLSEASPLATTTQAAPGLSLSRPSPSASLSATSPYFTTVARSSETRSTFTCPNCHNQVTILRKNVEVDCPTCHRPFESGWKVCPFDGTKKPVAKDDWRFCPICGKGIPDGVASLFTAPTPAELYSGGFQIQPNLIQPGLAPDYYAYQPRLDIAPFSAPSIILPSAELPVIHPPAGDYK